MHRDSIHVARRNFLKFVATSPYVIASGGLATFLEGCSSNRTSAGGRTSSQTADLITRPADAITVFDLKPLAQHNIQAAHWAYMTGGVEEDGTVRANRDAFQHVQLRPRRLRDATKVDTRIELFGTTYDSPIFICPVSGMCAFHPDGESAVARAAKARGTLQFLSTMASTGVEDVNQALGRPVWYQLYAPTSWPVCEQLLQRVQAAGCSVIALTVDNTTGSMGETYLRERPKNLEQCVACHGGEPGTPKFHISMPMYERVNMSGVSGMNPAMDWGFVDRLRKFWQGKLIIKGLDTGEDARLCLEHGVDAILVSNHGGRATETLRATLEALPEIVAAVNGRIPVFVDGGFRRGTDAFKALALGAKAVGIGRPCVWGLGAFGQVGVDRVLEILQGELKMIMGNCGTRTVADITREYVAIPDWHS